MSRNDALQAHRKGGDLRHPLTKLQKLRSLDFFAHERREQKQVSGGNVMIFLALEQQRRLAAETLRFGSGQNASEHATTFRVAT